MTAFCSHPSELALCSPQRTHSPAPGLCLWHLWLPSLAWSVSSVYAEPQSERVISQLVWLSEPSRLTLFRSTFPGLHPWKHCSVPSETALEFTRFQQFHFYLEAMFRMLEQRNTCAVVWSGSKFRACSPLRRWAIVLFMCNVVDILSAIWQTANLSNLSDIFRERAGRRVKWNDFLFWSHMPLLFWYISAQLFAMQPILWQNSSVLENRNMFVVFAHL